MAKPKDPNTDSKHRIHLRLLRDTLEQAETIRAEENRPSISNVIEWLVSADFQRRFPGPRMTSFRKGKVVKA